MGTQGASSGPLSQIFDRMYLPLILLVLVCIALVLSRFIYNLYFHPLAKFPGPILWRASHLPRYIAELRGDIDNRIRNFHAVYGDVLRISPDQLTFSTSAAWKDIHGYGDHHLPRDPEIRGIVLQGIKEPGILQASQKDHARMRRSLAHAFSEKALREQEPLIRGFVDELMSQLEDSAAKGEKVDMAQMYTRTTVDITSELSFGTSFNTLRDERLREWMAMQSRSGKMLNLIRWMIRYPVTKPIFKATVPKDLIEFLTINRRYVSQVVEERLKQGAMEEKRDFTSYMLKNREEGKGMTDGELTETSRTLILAGADTTRNVLSTATYFLLRNPEALERVVKEVRTTFQKEEDINFTTVTASCPYMLASLDESMRLRPPVTSILLSRITPSGPPTSVAGYDVPANMLVCAHSLSMNHSSRNYHDPNSFHPERWLPLDATSPFINDDRAASQPFFIGPRNCIGRNLAYNKMRIILARVLWNFDLELCEESYKWTDQKLWVLYSDKPLMCRLKLREEMKSS